MVFAFSRTSCCDIYSGSDLALCVLIATHSPAGLLSRAKIVAAATRSLAAASSVALMQCTFPLKRRKAPVACTVTLKFLCNVFTNTHRYKKFSRCARLVSTNCGARTKNIMVMSVTRPMPGKLQKTWSVEFTRLKRPGQTTKRM